MLLALALGLVASQNVHAAIERAIVERMGNVRVVVRTVLGHVPPLDVARGALSDRRRASPESPLVATIEPSSRLGQPIRFILSADGKRVGSVVASLDVTGEAVRSRRSIARDEEIGASDVDTAVVAITNVVLRRMPVQADIVGTRARRDIAAGELLTQAAVVVPPAVRSGDEVRVVVTMGPVQASGVGRASGSGQVGDMVRVLTTSSRKTLNARITGRGAVEIVR